MSLSLIDKYASNGLSPSKNSLDFELSIKRDQISFLKPLSKVLNHRKEQLLNAKIERDMKYFSQQPAKKKEEPVIVDVSQSKYGGKIP